MRRFVIGDIHGRYKALKEVFKKSSFDYDKDKLIILGDVVDGGYNTNLVVEELLKIKNKIFIIGNHDEWFMNHIRSEWAEQIWLSQGGRETLSSYKDQKIPVIHQEFFNKGKYYHVEDKMVFVHAGFTPDLHPSKERKFTLVWDRDLIKYARAGNVIKQWESVFVGHTTTQTYGSTKPIKFNNLWMLDCGAGFTGKLCIMDIDTKDYWLSKSQPNDALIGLEEV
ncbi:MAG: metallophosphoesterase [Nanoarchaeota archaeon]|nr:metallophosphoesterase [Nanoarchaeota archaeon]